MRILVVDDYQDGAESMASALRLLHHEVLSTYTGSTAVKLSAAFRPGLVLLDIAMSGIDGYETCRVIRQLLGNKVRIIAVTGHEGQEHRERCAQAGFDASWSKPVDWDVLKHELILLAELDKTELSM